MTYADMDKRKMMLPDLLGKPKAKIDENGNFVALEDFEFPPNHYVFFYQVEEWIEINEILGR